MSCCDCINHVMFRGDVMYHNDSEVRYLCEEVRKIIQDSDEIKQLYITAVQENNTLQSEIMELKT